MHQRLFFKVKLVFVYDVTESLSGRDSGTLKVLQIVYEKKKSLKIQTLDTVQHINWYLQFEWYQILQYSVFSVTKTLYPKISGQHITQTSATIILFF